MNEREKILNALTHMLAARIDLEQTEAALNSKRIDSQAAERELVRVLKATKGVHSRDGVVWKGKRYFVGEDDQLAVEEMAAEVLG